MTALKPIVLGYSGGLDTTYCAIYLREKGFEPVCVTVDVGQGINENLLRANSQAAGIKDLRIVDGREDFANFFIAPAILANALYQGVYPLATALSRPLISKVMVDVARDIGTNDYAHGCTGKGNDQVRMELAIRSLAPGDEIQAPIRECNLSRDEEIVFLEKRGIQLGITREKPYSVDQNIWGRSVCAGILENAEIEPPEEVFEWTASIAECPEKGELVELVFEKGLPKSINGVEYGLLGLIEELNKIGGRNGVGRIDHIEDRLVGIKSRELYEAPAALLIVQAHQALEALTLTKSSLRFKKQVETEYAELSYLGTWFSSHHFDLVSYLKHNQRNVTGKVALRLCKGSARIAGRSAVGALYDKNMATYSSASTFDQRLAGGFSQLIGNESQIAARNQVLRFDEESRLLRQPPEEK